MDRISVYQPLLEQKGTIGHKAQGRTADAAKLVVEDTLAMQNAGAQMILVEAVPPEVTRYIHQKLFIPVLSSPLTPVLTATVNS